jgi:hypothetical protein
VEEGYIKEIGNLREKMV